MGQREIEVTDEVIVYESLTDTGWVSQWVMVAGISRLLITAGGSPISPCTAVACPL